ncbi:MAG: DUF1573 domain-containing protein [Bacteroidales bacterium]|nr:DUF1573 domain-containing protein [Bacteroidales bacterium]MBQ3916610.1 DUF1573 domain-containing protein [Bacteroidales bacterium]
MNLRRGFLVALLLTFCPFIYGQDPSIVFSSSQWDFGRVKEEDGVLSHEFRFVNLGDSPVRISSVRPGCSCIRADYDDIMTVAPGSKGEVSVFFDPAGASGEVFRNLEVFFADGAGYAILSVKADVIPAPRSLESMFPFILGDGLRVDGNLVRLGFMNPGMERTGIIHVVNSSDREVSLRVVNPDFGSPVEIVGPEVLGPGETGEIRVDCRMPMDRRLFRTYSDSLLVFSGGKQCQQKLVCEAIFVGYTPREGQAAPSIWTNPSSAPMKSRFFSDERRGFVTVGNRGEAPLYIFAVEAPDGVSVSIKAGTVLKPDSSIVVTASSMKRNFSVRLFTNDPVRPIKDLIFN